MGKLYRGGCIIWKCRRCGKEDRCLHSPSVLDSLLAVLNNLPQPFGGCFPVKMHGICYCDDGRFGIQDLIGGDLDKEDPVVRS